MAHDRLARLGVDRALGRAGARPGDVVHIGDLSFEYEDSDVFDGGGDRGRGR